MDPVIISGIVVGVLGIIGTVIRALIMTNRVILLTELFRWRRTLPPGFIIFINGASGVGKTTIAWALARKYNVPPMLGTDIVRETLRYDVVDDPDNPNRALMVSSFLAHTRLGGYNALEELEELEETERVRAGFVLQCQLLLGALMRVVKRLQNKRDPAIIEGVNLVASHVFKCIPHDPHSKCVFVNLYLESKDKHIARLRQRGQKSGESEDATNRYVQHIQPIRAIDHFLREDSSAYGTTAVDAVSNLVSIENSGSIHSAVNKIDKIVKRKLRKIKEVQR